MSTPQEPQSPQTEPAASPEPNSDEREAKFWARLKQEINSTIDEREKKREANKPPGEQRTGRSTIFDEFAKFMGGPFAKKDS